jgi:hypothetical protein
MIEYTKEDALAFRDLFFPSFPITFFPIEREKIRQNRLRIYDKIDEDNTKSPKEIMVRVLRSQDWLLTDIYWDENIKPEIEPYLFEKDLEDMPLLINHEAWLVAKIAGWRMSIAK